jgi:hypothetical protein
MRYAAIIGCALLYISGSIGARRALDVADPTNKGALSHVVASYFWPILITAEVVERRMLSLRTLEN